MKKRLFLSVCLLLLVAVGSAVADPRINYPGTRARAMGGAFSAVADDASAMWYNPAGLAFPGRDITLEISDAVERNRDTNWTYDDSDTTLFLAGKWGPKVDEEGEPVDGGGFGVSFYEPYNLAYGSNHPEATGLLMEDMNLLAFGAAGNWGRLKVGGTFEFVYIDLGDSELYGPWDNKLDLGDDDSSIGISASVGALYTIPYKKYGLTTKLGAVYRAKSVGHEDAGPVELQGVDIVLAKPESWDIGASFAKSFTDIASTLILAVQYGSTDYGSMNDSFFSNPWEYDKTSLGAEFVYSKPVLFFKDIALRLGKYTSEHSESNLEIEGVSFGVGTRIGERFGLEITQEERKFEGNWSSNPTLDLLSVSANWSF